MNHNDFSTKPNEAIRVRKQKQNEWEFQMIYECKAKHGITFTIYDAPQMSGASVVPGKSWYFLTMTDGVDSEILQLKDTQAVDALLEKFDADPSTNVIARLMDSNPKIESWVYDFSPGMRADADGWKLQDEDKKQIHAVLAAATQAAEVKKNRL